jgi:transcriptional regulator with XRE-family HTH domain
VHSLRLNRGAFDVARGSQTVEQFADRLGLNRATVYRVMGGTAPSAKFIAQTVTALPYRFDDLFDVVEDLK